MVKSTELALEEWLSRPGKTFVENLEFGLKICKSLEFALQNKYEIVIKWLANKLADQQDTIVIESNLLIEVVSITFPQHLVHSSTKNSFVNNLRSYVNSIIDQTTCLKCLDIFLALSENHSYRIFFRSNTETYFRLQRAIFSCYATCIKTNALPPSCDPTFYEKGVINLKNFVARQTNVSKDFGELVLDVLVELSLYLHAEKGLYNEILSILKSVFFNENEVTSFLNYAFCAPLHVSMFSMDFAINHFRAERKAIASIIKHIVNNRSPPEIELYRSAHILDLFRKYNVSVDFDINGEGTGVSMLAAYVERSITSFAAENLKLVLILTCSAFRLNPMSLEKDLFRITVQFMFAHKSENDWHEYVEFLILVIDMFKKLGRSEKLILYLLRSLKGQLEMGGVCGTLKRKGTLHSDGTKRKVQKLDSGSVEVNCKSNPINEKFLNILRKEFTDVRLTTLRSDNKWRHISTAWPNESVGQHFTKFVTSLMSKPSLVLWKTLIFSLNDSIIAFQKVPPNEANLILIDFNAALFCQYLAGTRLPEQADNFCNEITLTRTITQKVLKDFGQMLFENEHHNRTIDAFLEVCYHIRYFDFITAYYSKGSFEIPELNSYFSKDQWVALEQRVINFGSRHAKRNMNMLHFLNMKMDVVFHSKDIKNNFVLSSETLKDSKLVDSMLEDCSIDWLISRMQKDEKRKICNFLLSSDNKIDTKIVEHLMEDIDFLELSVFRAFELASACFKSKKSLMAMIGSDSTVEQIRQLIELKSDNYKIKSCDVETLKELLQVLVGTIPIGFSSATVKPKIFAMTVALFRDIVAVKNDELRQLCLETFSKILNFGSTVGVFSYFDIDMLLAIFPSTQYSDLYQCIFESPNIWTDSTELCLSKFHQSLENHKFELNDNEIAFAIAIVQYQQQCSSKKIKHIMGNLLDLLVDHIEFHLCGNNVIEEKGFFAKTAAIMPIYLHRELVKNNSLEEFRTNIKHIYRKYIKYLQGEDTYPKIAGAAIQHRKPLGFDSNEIDSILREIWEIFLANIKIGKFDEKNEEILKYITTDQKAEYFMQIFSYIEKEADCMQSCKILCYLSKCTLGTYGGAILNSYAHIMICNRILPLINVLNNQFENKELILITLDLMEAICLNKKHAISMEFIDNILTFLMDLRIKHCPSEDGAGSRKFFYKLYQGIIRVCSELFHCRSTIIISRIPQLIYVYRELLQALVMYRNDRLKFSELSAEEINELAVLAHDLENLMHRMAKNNTEMKRISPYLLTHVIATMVASNNSTVRYPKVKLHIENICYELIAICDHRARGFILRSANDAVRQIYENISKDYEKYQKFKGKA